MSSAQSVIETLQLTPHPEGGYFRRIYGSAITSSIGPNQVQRRLLTSIYYLLTSDSPIGHLHVNRSDIVHFFLAGNPITYTLVSPTGKLSMATLGPDIQVGQQLHLVVPSGWWKASELASGEYGLISEAVSPGFEYEDMRLITSKECLSRFPQLNATLKRYCRD